MLEWQHQNGVLHYFKIQTSEGMKALEEVTLTEDTAYVVRQASNMPEDLSKLFPIK